MSRSLVWLTLAMLGCHAPTVVQDTPLPVPGSRELRIGEVVPLDDTPYILRLVEVEGDSRCPVEALCVWAGEVRLQAVLAARPGMGLPDRVLQFTSQRPIVADGIEFRIAEVTPVAHAGRTIAQGDYRLTIATRPAP